MQGSDRMTRSRKWGRVVAAVVVLVIVGLLAWDIDWLKPLIERRASAALGRNVAIAHIRVHWARDPILTLTGIRVAEPAGFEAIQGDFASLDQLAVTIDPWPALHGAVVLPAIDVGNLELALQALPDGRNNWSFQAPSPPSGTSQALQSVTIGRLSIVDGRVHLVDPQFKSDFEVSLATVSNDGEQPLLRADANGRYAGQSIVAHFTGDSLLDLRDTQQPYHLQLEVTNGSTALDLHGSLRDPLQFAGADLALHFGGQDMANLYPLTGVPLPHTAPFDIGGQLDYADRAFRFRDFSGRVGDSDLAGTIAIEPFHQRRRIVAALHSRKVVLADLAGFIGAPPGKAGSATQGAVQKAAQAQKEASPRILPDEPINLPKVRVADFDVHYAADHIEGQRTPLDNLKAHLTIDNGRMELEPLDFSVGDGHIVTHLALDGTQSPALVNARVDFSHVDLGRILGKSVGVPGAGDIGGTAALDSRGNSVAQLLGRGNGGLKLFLGGGDLSALLVNLAGLDFGNTLLSAIGLPSRTHLRCMIGDFGLDKGVLDTHMLLVDTDAANIVGDGKLNFTDETIDYRIHTETKHLSVGALKSPIDIDGTFKTPHVRPEAGPLAARAGVAAVLGIFATPLAALIPTLQLGLGKDNDCGQLIATVQAQSEQMRNSKGSPH
jgi:uncharacterized protein involved in outer membrane biogenesis